MDWRRGELEDRRSLWKVRVGKRPKKRWGWGMDFGADSGHRTEQTQNWGVRS